MQNIVLKFNIILTLVKGEYLNYITCLLEYII